MSKLNAQNQAVPATPAAGQTFIYVDNVLKVLSTIDDTGTVINYGSGGGGGTPLIPVTGTGTATGNTNGDLAGNQLLVLNGAGRLLFIDSAALNFAFGDISGGGNSNFLKINDATNQIQLGNVIGGNNGLFLDVTAGTKTAEIDFAGNQFLSIDVINGIYKFGDISGAGNSCDIEIDDLNKNITVLVNGAGNSNLQLDQTAGSELFILSTTAGGGLVELRGELPAQKMTLTALLYNIANLSGKDFANNAAALAGGLVSGDLYVITGSDPKAVAIVI